MTNTSLNSLVALSSAASVTERVGVVLRRSEYTVPRHVQVQSPLIATHDTRRVVFVIRLDGGIGSEGVTIDQTLDAVSVLIEENDQVSVSLVDDVHVESTVAPIFPWAISTGTVEGRVLRRGEYLNSNGQLCTASLVLGDNGLVVVVPAASEFAREEVVERCGVILRRSEYTRKRNVPVTSPLVNTKDDLRVVFLVRLDGGIGSELVTIDQTLDATAALLDENDQVLARLVDNVHIESTVAPIFPWGNAADIDASALSAGRVLRSGAFLNSKGAPSVASLVLTTGQSSNLVVDVQAR